MACVYVEEFSARVAGIGPQIVAPSISAVVTLTSSPQYPADLHHHPPCLTTASPDLLDAAKAFTKFPAGGYTISAFLKAGQECFDRNNDNGKCF